MANRTKKRKIQLKEQQDAEGISRQVSKGKTINLSLFILIKLILILLIPILYFLYSPLLLFDMILIVGLFFIAKMAERGENKSVVKANHIHIFKFDSALALILIIIAFCGAIGTITTKERKGNFDNFQKSEVQQIIKNDDFTAMRLNNFWSQTKKFFVNWGSLLTGDRNYGSTNGTNNFGFGEPPENFVTDGSEIAEEQKQEGSEKSADDKIKFSMDDLPMNYMYSSIISTVDTIIIFTIAGMGFLSIIAIVIKKRKFDTLMNATIDESKPLSLSDDEIDRILSFGEDVIDCKNYNIDEKIKEQELKDKNQKEIVSNNQIKKEVVDQTNIPLLDKKPGDEI
jgi:hypothetical protein